MTNNEWLNSLSVHDKTEFICSRELSDMVTSLLRSLNVKMLTNPASPEYEMLAKSAITGWLLKERS